MKQVLISLLLFTFLGAKFPTTYAEFLLFPPVRYGIMENYHLPEHTAGIALVAYSSKKLGFDPLKTKHNLLWVMLGFEFYQLIMNNFDPMPVYGSIEKWAYDSAGDVLIPYWVMSMILSKEKTDEKVNVSYNPFIDRVVFAVAF